MKKLLSGLVAIVVLLVLATNVNAASLKASATQLPEGAYVTVYVDYTNPTKVTDLTLTYDSKYFEYVKDSFDSEIKGGTSVNDKTAGTIKISGSDASKTTKKVSFVFKALKETTAETKNFEASGFEVETGINEQLDNSKVKVTVVKAGSQTEGGSTETPAETPKDETKDGENEGIVGADGNVIKKLPKTGSSYALLAVAGVVVATAVVAKKYSK